jgi:hypothetical protein
LFGAKVRSFAYIAGDARRLANSIRRNSGRVFRLALGDRFAEEPAQHRFHLLVALQLPFLDESGDSPQGGVRTSQPTRPNAAIVARE